MPQWYPSLGCAGGRAKKRGKSGPTRGASASFTGAKGLTTATRKLLGYLRVFHVFGGLFAFSYFSYRYAQEHGFLAWLFFGEMVPALKATVWEVFLVMALVQAPPSSTPAIEELWWLSEYPALLKAVEDGPNSTLSTAYTTGPAGSGIVKLELVKQPDRALVLRIRLPREAFVATDPNTGVRTPVEEAPVITIRDDDLDGVPDDWRVEPSGKPLHEEEFTGDGFVKYRASPDHRAILVQWSIAVGYSTNHFLHGIDRAMPRR